MRVLISVFKNGLFNFFVFLPASGTCIKTAVHNVVKDEINNVVKEVGLFETINNVVNAIFNAGIKRID